MTVADKIRQRIAEKRAEYENYKGYLAMRAREEDLHGVWDASINMSEVSMYIDGLEFALAAVEQDAAEDEAFRVAALKRKRPRP